MDIAQEMLTTFKDDPDLLITGAESKVYGYDIETKAQTSQSKRSNQDQKKHAEFGQMLKLCSLCSSIAKACCIMNSCHKVVQG